MMTQTNQKEEQILIRITGQDRPGLTASVMEILARYGAHILDIGQADCKRCGKPIQSNAPPQAWDNSRHGKYHYGNRSIVTKKDRSVK